MAQKITHTDLVISPNKATVILSGPPKALKGQIEFHNSGKANIVVRNATLKDAKGLEMASRSLPTLNPFVLRPSQGRTVPLKIALAATTPPGEYRVKLEMAGQTQPAVLHVTEVFALNLRPQSMVVSNNPEQSQQKQLVIANEGNVPFTLGEFGDVDLKQDLVWERVAQVAVEPLANNPNINLDELVVAILRVAREEAEPDGTATVRNLTGEVKVMPGQTVAIDIEIIVNNGLPNNSRYRGYMPLLTKDLEIIVVSSGHSIAEKSPKDVAISAKKPTTKPQSTVKGKGKGGKR